MSNLVAIGKKVELSNDLESLRKAEASAVNWSNFQGSNGIVPGGQLDKLNKERLSTLEKYKLEIESKKQIALEAERPSPTRGNLLNIKSLEEDLEKSEDKLLMASQKLDKAATAADDADRMRKVLENRAIQVNY